MVRKYNTPTKEYKPDSAFDTAKPEERSKLWHERLRRSGAMLHIKERSEDRQECMRYIDGTYKGSSERVYFNEALPAIEDLISSTVPKIPRVDIEARQLEQEGLARKVGALIDATLESDLVLAHEAITACEWDEIGYGIGIVRMSWQENHGPWPYKPTTDEEYLIPHVAKAQIENESPETAEIADADDHIVHVQIHEQSQAEFPDESLEAHILAHWERVGTKRWAHPLLRRISPEKFLYDPDAETWDARGWEAELCNELVADLQRVPGVKKMTKENCPPLDDEGDSQERISEEFDYEKQRVQIWKIHDRVNRQWIFLSVKEGSTVVPILEEDWPFGSIEIYDRIVHRPVAGQIHGRATMSMIVERLEELARTNAIIRRHNRRASKYKKLLPRSSGKNTAKQLNSDNPIEYIEAGALNGAQDFKPPPLPPELVAYRETLLAELRRDLGADVMTQGGDTPHEISASEAQLRGGYQQGRMARRRQVISRLLSWVAVNIPLMYRDFSEDEILVRVLGPMGVEIQSLSPTAIPDDLLVAMDIEAVTDSRQQEKMAEASKFVEMLTKIAPGLYDPMIVMTWLGEQLNIHSPAKFFIQAGQMGGPAAEISQPGGGPGSTPTQINTQPSAPGIPDLTPNLKVAQ